MDKLLHLWAWVRSLSHIQDNISIFGPMIDEKFHDLTCNLGPNYSHYTETELDEMRKKGEIITYLPQPFEQLFAYAHLPEDKQKFSKPFHDFALNIWYDGISKNNRKILTLLFDLKNIVVSSSFVKR